MNRRKAIGRLMLTGTGAIALISGYKWYEVIKSPDLDYLYKKKDLIAFLSEMIIPRTDTPGAIDAGVPDFIIMMITECTDKKSKNKFIEGLKDLEYYSFDFYDKQFVQCSSAEKESILSHFDKQSKPLNNIMGKIENRFLGKPFFITLKELTVEGYCTSKAGAQLGLSYISVPGNYHGCIPLGKGQKAWATN